MKAALPLLLLLLPPCSMILAKLAASSRPQVASNIATAAAAAADAADAAAAAAGFMILAKLAASITQKPFITLVRELFPSTPTTPIFAASDTGQLLLQVDQ
jgi:hypothetical protein